MSIEASCGSREGPCSEHVVARALLIRGFEEEPMETSKTTLASELKGVQGVLDEIRLQAHLAALDAKQKWPDLERRVEALESHGAKAWAEIRAAYRDLTS